MTFDIEQKMDKVMWHKLQSSYLGGVWRFIDYIEISKEIDKVYDGFFFYNETNFIYKDLKFVKSIVIKTQLVDTDETTIRVKFIPFILLQSPLDVQDLVKIFNILYESDNIIIDDNMIKEEVNRFMYDAIVYRLSIYALVDFNCLLSKYDNIKNSRKLNVSEVNSSCLCESVLNLYEKLSSSDISPFYELPLGKLYKIGIFKKEGVDIVVTDDHVLKSPLNYKDVLSYVNLYLTDCKREATKNNSKQRFTLSSEELLRKVADEYYLGDILDRGEKTEWVTKLILQFLEDNLLCVDIWQENSKIYTEFSLGANIDLWFYFNIKYVYAGMLAFYDRLAEEANTKNVEDKDKYIAQEFQKRFRLARDLIELYLRSNQYFGYLLSYKDFLYACAYFEKIVDDLARQIGNKRNLYDEKDLLSRVIYRYIQSRDIN